MLPAPFKISFLLSHFFLRICPYHGHIRSREQKPPTIQERMTTS
nr:MAG TPA: hypothetical protein [Caudoviricetes sp.]